MATSSHPPAVPETLPKGERVRKRAEYLDVQGRGRKLATEHLLVFVRTPEDAGTEARPCRIGLTVSKKVGGAVVRNRVKRRLREVFRRHKRWFPAHRDVVIIAKPGAAEASYEALEHELEKVCGRHFARS